MLNKVIHQRVCECSVTRLMIVLSYGKLEFIKSSEGYIFWSPVVIGTCFGE